MMDERNSNQNTSPTSHSGFSPSTPSPDYSQGTYHWTREELNQRTSPPQDASSLYGYPLYQGETPDPYASSPYSTPPSYSHPPVDSTPKKAKAKKEKSPREKRQWGGGFVALMLVMALLGGAIGGSATSWVITNRFASAPVSSSSEDTQQPALPASTEPIDRDSNVVPLPQSTLSGDIPSVVEKAAPSVVEIRLRGTVMTFFGAQESESAGSGVVFSQDGYIITNNHVIEDGEAVTVRTSDGMEYEAVLVGTDPKTDLAVIKIDAEGLVPVTFADSDSVRVGQLAVAIGNPLGTLGGTVTDGVVSAKDREITIDEQSMTLMQTSAAVNPGNSGGGLFDGNGNLIGIVNAKSSGSDIEGLGFAIPSNTVTSVVDDLIQVGYVTGRPELGIKVLLVNDLRTMNYYGVSGNGVFIIEVTRNNGLKMGDRIISIDGIEVETPTQVSEAVLNSRIGDSLLFVIERGGATMEVAVPVAEQIPEGASLPSAA